MAERSRIDQLLDLFVFVPAGLLLEGRELLPKLAEKGRQQLGPQVQLARLVGRMAVAKGQREAVKAAARLGSTASSEPAPVPVPAAPAAAPRVAYDVNGHRSEDGAVAAADTLAIPSYDTLAASQVVSRLDGLSAGELEAVRRYEVAHRGRKTVLGKVAQLQRR
jgi:hypothetical protein